MIERINLYFSLSVPVAENTFVRVYDGMAGRHEAQGIYKVPFTCYIKKKGKQHCGCIVFRHGEMFELRMVLTAAHCVRHDKTNEV